MTASTENDTQKFWSLIEGSTACMVTTNDDGLIRSRPMAPYIDEKAGLIRFLTDRTSAKVEELHHDRDIALSFVDSGKMIYVSVSGRGEVTTDPALIKELWGPAADIWFPGGPEEADIAVVVVHPQQAEFWDNDANFLKAGFEVAKGYFTDEAPDLGDNAKVDLEAA